MDGLLAYRASAFFNKEDGFIRNIGPLGGTTSVLGMALFAVGLWSSLGRLPQPRGPTMSS